MLNLQLPSIPALDFDKTFGRSASYFSKLQGHICAALEGLERRGGGSATFQDNSWQHPSGGGGLSRVMVDGLVFEKAGVNYSCVKGSFPPEIAAGMPGTDARFNATGISLVLHPRNPHVPTVHANFRHIARGRGNGQVAWFGGGSDLTPYYLRRDDAIHFHRTWKTVCDRHPAADHARFKKWCDDYFYLPHRQECRGIGGIFFDYLTGPLDEIFEFVRDAGDHFLDAYQPIVERRMSEPYTQAQRNWQLMRRGRYVEFNLLCDRGTMFGLKTGGCTESILMSLPLHAMWGYNQIPSPGTAEADLIDSLKPRDWHLEKSREDGE